MKLITRISAAVLAFSLLSVIACTNILGSDSGSESNNQNNNSGKITLTGTIDTSGIEGAFPSALINSSANRGERSASYSTLPTTVDYFAKATKRGTTIVVGTAADECTWMGDDSDKSFAMNLDYGTWDVVAGICVAGSGPDPAPNEIIYISSEQEIELPDGAPLIYNAHFNPRPRMSSSGMGTIKLSMTKPSGLKFASCKLLVGDSSAWETAGFTSEESVAGMSVAGNTVHLGNAINGTQIKSGAYTVQIKFYDCLDYDINDPNKNETATLTNGKGILVYSTIQTINVFDNLETNYWTRTVNDDNSPVSATGGSFVLTDDKVNAFNRDRIYVSSSGSDSNSGTAYQPYLTLSKAISYIDSQGISSKNYTITLTGEISDNAVISTTTSKAQKITITGSSNVSDILSGGDASPVLTVSGNVPVVIQNLQITSSYSVAQGGGISMSAGSDVSLESGALVTDCKAIQNGGGVYNAGGTLRIKGGKITNNHIIGSGNGYGGIGVYLTSGASCIMESGQIEVNDGRSQAAIRGGAIYMSGASTFQMSGGTLYGNKTGNIGAQIYAKSSSASDECIIEISGDADISGGVISSATGTAASGDALGSVAWLEGAGVKMTMSGGKIYGNTAIPKSDKAGCSGVYLYKDASFTMTGGLIHDNEITGGIARGGAIGVKHEDGYNPVFKMSGTAYIPYGGSEGKNDVELDSGRTITVDGAINPTVDGKSGSTAITNSAATIMLPSWARGTSVLSKGDHLSELTDAIADKFDFTDSGWEKRTTSSLTKLDSDIYVAGSNPQKCTTASGASDPTDTNTIGNWTHPFASISAATALLDADHQTIIVDGTVTGAQQSVETLPGGVTAVNIKGYKTSSTASSAATIKRYSSEPGSYSSLGTALKINTTVPVTIEDITITGGKSNVAGGGIYLKQSGTLKLGNGVKITGNSTTNKGGGVYVDEGAKLFMYGTSLIGDSTTSTVLATDAAGGGGSANTAIMGGGIHNEKGEVYIGYDGLTGSPATPHKCDMITGYGIRRNYVSGELYSVGAGLSSIQGNVYISSGTISYNQSTISGGGIYSDGDSSHPAKIIIEAPVSSDNEFTMYGNKSVVGGAIHNSSYTTLTMSAGKIGGSSGQQNTATNLGGAIYQGANFTVSGSALIYPGSATSSLKTNDVYLPAGNFYVTAGSIGTSGNTSSLKMSLSPQEYKRGKKLVQADGVTVDATLWNKFQLTDNDGDWTKQEKVEDAGTSNEKKYVAITAPVYVAGPDARTITSTDKFGKGLTIEEGGLGTKSKPFKFISDAVGVFEDGEPAVITIIGPSYPVAQEIPDTFTTSNASSLTLKGYSSSVVGTIKRYDTAPSTAASDGSALTVNSTVPVTIQDLIITGGKTSGNGGGINIIKTGASVTLASGAQVIGNTATNGGGVYVPSGTTLDMQDGMIGGYSTADLNTATTAGGAVYQGGTLKMKGSSKLRFGGNSENTNDVFLAGDNTIEVYDALGSGCGATITPSEWKRGKVVLSGTYYSYYSTQFNVSDLDWSIGYRDSTSWSLNADLKSRIGAEIWVANTYNSATLSSDVGNNVSGGKVPQNTNRGTKSQPYADFATALSKCWDSDKDFTIHIDGTIGGNQTISGTINASQLLLMGHNTSGTSAATFDGKGSGSTLKVDKSGMAVYINNLKITNGRGTADVVSGVTYYNGGGIYLKAGSVFLRDGAVITGNEVLANGGGVYVAASGATLYVTGKALIGDSASSTTRASSSGTAYYANKAAYGAGIYNNGGSVFIGCSSGGTTASGYTLVNNATDGYYGVRRNLCTTGGAGIYHAGGILKIASGDISYNFANTSGSTSGGAVYLKEDATINGGTFIGNKAANGGAFYIYTGKQLIISGAAKITNNEATLTGGAVCNDGTLTMSAGSIGEEGALNSIASGGNNGGAIYQNGTFNVSGSALVYTGSLKSNDVYLPGTNVVTINNNYTGSGNTASNKMALTLETWKRGKSVLDGSKKTYTNAGYFMTTDSEWSVLSDLINYGKLDADIWVSESAISGVTGGVAGDDSNGLGTKKKPYKTIKEALKQCWGGPNDCGTNVSRTINIVGTLNGAQAIEESVTTSKASAIVLEGKPAGISSAGTLDGGFSSEGSKGRTLTIASAVPITIQNLTIKGAYTSDYGGGIYVNGVAGAKLTLGAGASVTGNRAGRGSNIYFKGTSTTKANLIMKGTGSSAAASVSGGQNDSAVYIEYANLCMSGYSVIGDTTASVAESDENANVGSGVMCGTGASVWLGYSEADTSKTETLQANYGICRNYGAAGGAGIQMLGEDNEVYMASGSIKFNKAGTTGQGGGIYSRYGTQKIHITGGTISRNTAMTGGGIYTAGKVFLTGTANIGGTGSGAASATTGNVATQSGAGIYISTSGVLYMGYTSCDNAGKPTGASEYSGKINQNYNASASGGGLDVRQGTVYFNSGTISNNYAQYGGAIYNQGTVVIDDKAYIPAGSGAGYNDVYVHSGYPIDVSAKMTKHTISDQIAVTPYSTATDGAELLEGDGLVITNSNDPRTVFAATFFKVTSSGKYIDGNGKMRSGTVVTSAAVNDIKAALDAAAGAKVVIRAEITSSNKANLTDAVKNTSASYVNLDLSQITIKAPGGFSSLFKDCSKLKEITFNFKTFGLTKSTSTGTFVNCHNLEKVTVYGDSTFSNGTWCKESFYGTASLKTIEFMDAVNIDFYGTDFNNDDASSLNPLTVILPQTLENLKLMVNLDYLRSEKLITRYKGPFSGEDGLQMVHIEKNDPYLNCGNLVFTLESGSPSTKTWKDNGSGSSTYTWQ